VRPPVYQIAIVVGLMIAVLVVVLIVTRKVSRNVDSYLAEHGLAKASDCPVITIDDRQLEGVHCYRGNFAPNRAGVLFVGHFKNVGGYKRYIGVQVAGDDAWHARLKLQPAYADHATVAWIMNETRDNAEQVVTAVTGALD
jgi:hypothetical protein